MAEPNVKVELIMIPTKKLFLLVKTMRELRANIPKDSKFPKDKLKRYKLKIKCEVLNSLLNNYGISKLMDKYVRTGELVEAIEQEGEDDE